MTAPVTFKSDVETEGIQKVVTVPAYVQAAHASNI